MERATLKQLIRVQSLIAGVEAIKAEIEGMKATNKIQFHYDEADFNEKAGELRGVVSLLKDIYSEV